MADGSLKAAIHKASALEVCLIQLSCLSSLSISEEGGGWTACACKFIEHENNKNLEVIQPRHMDHPFFPCPVLRLLTGLNHLNTGRRLRPADALYYQSILQAIMGF